MSRSPKRKSNARSRNTYNPEEHPAYQRSLERVYKKVEDFSPLNEKQERYFELLDDNQIVIATGEPGTGKTLLPVVHALEKLRDKEIDTIYITKPAVEVGKTLGFLPGKIGDKFAPYMDSIVDHVEFLVGKQEKTRLMADGKIVCMPLEYLRGSNLDKCVIIADEMQNASYMQQKTLLTRLKDDAQLIMTGDLGQSDLDVESSLPAIMNVLSNVSGVGYIHFEVEDIVRSGIVKEIMLSFREYESKKRSNCGD